jgi:hypothetical protein
VSISLRNRIRRACLLGCASGAALLALAVGQAGAATQTTVAVNSPFEGSAEGWTAKPNEQNSLLGGLLCIEGVTCPAVKDEFHLTGGVAKTGFIETKAEGLLGLGLLAESKGTWESPEFSYLGVAGQQPTSLEFTIARRPELANLLALPGAGATYTVELVDKTTPSGTVVIVNGQSLSGAEEWKQASAPVSPTLLTVGDAYTVRIRTAFVTPVAVIPAGGVGYDNVALTASLEKNEGEKGKEGPVGPEGPSGSGGSNGTNGTGGNNGAGGATGTSGSNGSNGTNGSNGSSGSEGNGGKGTNGSGGTKGATGAGGGVSSAELKGLITSQGLSGASLRNGRLIVTGNCPKGIKTACTVRIQGMLTKTKVATSTGRAKIAKGGKHSFAIALKPQARHKIQTQTKILVKEWVRAGKARATVYKTLTLVKK